MVCGVCPPFWYTYTLRKHRVGLVKAQDDLHRTSTVTDCGMICSLVVSSVLEAVGFDAASTASASALPLPIAVISIVAITPTKLEAPYRFQNPVQNSI